MHVLLGYGTDLKDEVLPPIKKRDLEFAKNVIKILENHFNILYSDEETYEFALLLASRPLQLIIN
ncbi:hypothetical protein NDK43_27255 [Neobacillus pocheonensis]|uniref:Uncharacterized protein n=1 Tax=Neobacillus pocheonensis TaxID=363869 RepID=A0ABT0WGC0_9BACI|nr:hypothetical protein [Neobacillus pocheonensis]